MVTLIDAFARLEREIEGAVVEIAEDDFGADEERTVVGLSATPSQSESTSAAAHSKATANGRSVPNGHSSESYDIKANGSSNATIEKPTFELTPAQRRMARALNALPRLAKHMVYLDPMRNSHATIVARDVNGYPFHKRGWGVLQHWADGFVL